MELTDIPDDAYGSGESPPDLEALESTESLLSSGPIRERLLDVIVGLRTPTKVSTVADLADCDTETAREYLQWFEDMGMVHRHEGRPVRYERNDAYFQWRRIERIREEYAKQEIVEALADALEQLDDYRAQFDAEHPDEVSLVEATREQNLSTEAAWEALSEWESIERRARLLDAARSDQPVSGNRPDFADD